MSASGKYTVFVPSEHPLNTEYNWGGFTEIFSGDDENIAEKPLTEEQWSEFCDATNFDSLSRIYYYRVPGIATEPTSTLRAVLRDSPTVSTSDVGDSIEFDVDLVGDPYQYLLFTRITADSVLDELKGIAVVRPYSDTVAIRAPDREHAEAIHEAIATALGRELEGDMRPSFDEDFQREFEAEYVARYKELWIRDETQDSIAKRHFYAEEGADLRDSDAVPEYFGTDKHTLIGGYLELQTEISSDSGVSFHFQWEERRIAFKSKPGNRALLAASDAIINTVATTVEVPEIRTILADGQQIRIEVHEGFRATTWGTNIDSTSFGRIVLELDVSDDTPVLIQTAEGEDVVELSEFVEQRDIQPSFARVFTDIGDFTWERHGDETLLGVLTDNRSPDSLAALLQRTTDRSLPDETRAHIRQLSKSGGINA
jgi:hypothetical protein